MKCDLCGKGFRDDEKVIPILRYVVNHKRGDFVTSTSQNTFIHLHHLKEKK